MPESIGNVTVEDWQKCLATVITGKTETRGPEQKPVKLAPKLGIEGYTPGSLAGHITGVFYAIKAQARQGRGPENGDTQGIRPNSQQFWGREIGSRVLNLGDTLQVATIVLSQEHYGPHIDLFEPFSDAPKPNALEIELLDAGFTLSERNLSGLPRDAVYARPWDTSISLGANQTLDPYLDLLKDAGHYPERPKTPTS